MERFRRAIAYPITKKDFQMRLMLFEQQNKNHDQRRVELNASEDHRIQLKLLEQQNKKRLPQQRRVEDGAS